MISASQGGWNYRGFAYHDQASVTAVRQVFAVGADPTNEPKSSYANNDCGLMSLHLDFDSIAGGATTVEVSVWRDVAGDILVAGPDTKTILVGTTTATDGGAVVVYVPCVDHHRDSDSVNGDSDMNVTLYVGLKLNAGTAKCNIHLDWACAIGAQEPA